MSPVTQLKVLREMVRERDRRARSRRLRALVFGAMLVAAWAFSLVAAVRHSYLEGAVDGRLTAPGAYSCDADAPPEGLIPERGH